MSAHTGRATPGGGDERAWHAMPVAGVLLALGVSSSGLSTGEAAQRVKKYGPNRLPSAPAPSWWRVFPRQFASPLIMILAVAAGLSAVIGDVADAAFIGAVLLLNAMMGASQEWRAERGAYALRKLLRFRAKVERDGEVRELDAEAIVPGDVVWLESGNRVPADGRLLSATGLQVDESLLTGESLAVDKDARWIGAEETTLADRRNMMHAGTNVVRGRARAVVTATGMSSGVGGLAIGGSAGRPPLLVRLDRFSRMVGVASLVVSAFVVLVGVVSQGRGLAEMALFGVALAVSIIPEGLPVAITVALGIASSRMARRGVIVRRLGAVEGLGSCTLIASDKTGTMTCNEIMVKEIRMPGGEVYEVTGAGFVPNGEVRGVSAQGVEALHALARAAVLCNEADLHERNGSWAWWGDPTEVALLSMAHKVGVSHEALDEACAEVNRIPFEPEHRFAATFRRVDGAVRVYVKGAPERVLSMCAGTGAEEALVAARRWADDMGENGMRVLALAEGGIEGRLDESAAPPQPTGLRLLGLVGMIDPLRAGAAEAVAACGRAGVRVIMVTGDHPVTALAIARQLGLAETPAEVVTGEALERMNGDERRTVMARVRVFARVEPRQKLRIVEAAKDAGHFVAVTGDGANDAPALRAANIGVSMGKGGTDIARDASDLVISDDNFATIVAGVEQGRVAYDNVRKVIYMLASTGAAEVVTMGAAVAAGLPLPLLPVQLLWLNLVTNGIQDVSIGFEPAEPGVLQRAPRPTREPIFNPLMIERTVVAAAVMGGVSFGVFWWMLSAGWQEAEARNSLLLLMVLFENIHMGNCRSETRSALRMSPLTSPVLLIGTLGALSVHVLAMYLPPLRSVLKTSPVVPQEWACLVGLSLTVMMAIEAHKLIWNARERRRERRGMSRVSAA